MFKKLKAQSKIISAFSEFQKTYYYPILFAALCVLSNAFGAEVYVPVIWLLTFCVVFSALFCDDIKPILVPIVFIYYSIGRDASLFDDSTIRGDVFGSFKTWGLINLVICGVFMVAALVYRLIKSGALKKAVQKRGLFTISLIAFLCVFALNGIFSSKWQPSCIPVGLMEGGVMLVFYLLTLGVSDSTDNLINYVCNLLTILGFTILAEVAILSTRLALADQLFVRDDAGNIVSFFRKYTSFSWGEFNIVGALLSISALATMYSAYVSKKGAWYMAAASILYLGVVFANGRASILVGGVLVLIAAAFCSFKGKAKKGCRVYFASFMAAVVGFIVLLSVIMGGFDSFAESFKSMFRFSAGDNGRFDLWKNGLKDFVSAPIFGVGFLDGGYEPALNENFYSNMYHNILVEIIGATGVIGGVAFLLHLRCLGEGVLRRFSLEKLLLGLIPIFIVGASLLDNFFWYPNFQIFYGIFLALLEVKLEEARKNELANVSPIKRDKPRVVFTYVEAGKGHITPVEAVSQAFSQKYGDKCEVIDRYFYGESGDERLVSFEKGFATTVKLQNKNDITGILCYIGNAVSGDALGQRFLMRMTPGGIASYRRAVKKLKDIDADFVFTAHWATAYYASAISPRPYTMMLCPDAYSNGMFNMDCNEFLMSTESGVKNANKKRLYAGGNITKIPFPIRPEAFEIEKRKAEIREKLGIKDEFVVTLCDGGYGMAKLEKTACALANSDKNLIVFALCGTNDKLCQRLKTLKTSPTVKLVPIGFTDKVLEYVAVSDVFLGKSGANSMAEPAFFGVPIIVTRCITYIERWIKNYYVKEVGGALYIPNVKEAVSTVEYFADNKEARKTYADAMSKIKQDFGAEKIADLIFERLESLKENP